jgi:hypothetical protein
MSGDQGESLPAVKQAKPQISSELISSFIETQSKDIALKAGQLEFEKQKDKHALEFGKESLAAQERDRKHSRECARSRRRDRYICFAVFGVLGVALFGYALYLNKDAFAQEALKDLFLLGSGAAGGYGIGRNKKSHQSQAPQQAPPE